MSKRWGRVLKFMVWTVIGVSVLLAVTCTVVESVGLENILPERGNPEQADDTPLAYPDPTQPWDQGTMELPPQQ